MSNKYIRHGNFDYITVTQKEITTDIPTDATAIFIARTVAKFYEGSKSNIVEKYLEVYPSDITRDEWFTKTINNYSIYDLIIAMLQDCRSLEHILQLVIEINLVPVVEDNGLLFIGTKVDQVELNNVIDRLNATLVNTSNLKCSWGNDKENQ